MKRILAVLLFAVIIFARTSVDVFIPEEMTNETFFAPEEISDELDMNLIGNDVTEVYENLADVVENQSEVLLSINDASKTIVCDFLLNTTEEKIIEIVSISGISITEVSVNSSQKSVTIPVDKFQKGIYIIRILSKETKKSVLSKAIVVG
jgi:hypothetical protein